jgi:hypothetical protein
MQYLVLAADYDGTIAHDGVVEDDTIATLGRLHAQGLQFCVIDPDGDYEGLDIAVASERRTTRRRRAGRRATAQTGQQCRRRSAGREAGGPAVFICRTILQNLQAARAHGTATHNPVEEVHHLVPNGIDTSSETSTGAKPRGRSARSRGRGTPLYAPGLTAFVARTVVMNPERNCTSGQEMTLLQKFAGGKTKPVHLRWRTHSMGAGLDHSLDARPTAENGVEDG